MAFVYDAWDTRLRRPVAVKLLLPALVGNAQDRLHFELEARSAGALSHPNIVAVHDVGEDDGIPYIVMERLPGPSLDVRIAQGPIPQTTVRKVLGDVLVGLGAAHAAGILHRDIKPGNVVFSSTGDAKLADFGIAKTAESGVTATGHVLGTLAYLSPERLLGQPATPVDDLYALGVLGYEALTGRRPFGFDNPGALAQAILHDEPTPIPALRPDVDTGLVAVIARATARDPAMRFPDAEAMASALWGRTAVTIPPRQATRVMDVPVPLSQATAAGARLLPSRPRRMWPAIVAIASAFLLAIVLLGFGSSQPGPQRPAGTSTPSVTTTPPATTPAPSPPPSSVPPAASTSEDEPSVGGPANRPPKSGHGNGRDKGRGGD